MKPTYRLLTPLLFVLLASYLPMHAKEMDAESFINAFDDYVGVWQGEYKIFSQEDELLNKFKVNRNYWWEDSVLMERVSYDFGDVQQTYYHRVVLSEGMPFSFVTDTENPEKIRSALRGENLKGTMVWTRVLPKGSLPVRISERITEHEDSRYIEFWGDQEATDASGESMLVRIEGFLAYLKGSRSFVVAEKQDEAVIDSPEIAESLKENGVDLEPVSSLPEPSELPKSEPVFVEPEPEVTPDPVQIEPVEEVEDLGQVEPIEEVEEPAPVVMPALPKKSIEVALSTLNIVGINDEQGEECIVVDYFLLYKIGEQLDMDPTCVFSKIDENSLYFVDLDGFEYQIPRKDKTY